MSELSNKTAGAKAAFEDVTICLDGSLARQLEDAQNAVRRAVAGAVSADKGAKDSRLAKAGESLKAAQKAVEDAEAAIRAAAIKIRIFAVSFGEYNKFVIQNPPRKGQDESMNPQTFFIFVARRTGKYVADDGTIQDMSKEEWDDIEGSLSDGDHDRLAQAIVIVNRQDSTRGVDFLSQGSVKTENFSENSEPLKGSV